LALASLLQGVGCGSGSSTPSAPDEPVAVAPQVATRLSLSSVVPAVGDRSAISFEWGAVPGASGYVLEIGRSSGATDVGVLETGSPQPSFTWTPAPVGSFFFRMRGRNAAGTGPASGEIHVDSPDPRDVIVGLFLGQGPLRTSSGNVGCYRPGTMSGWRRGTNLRIIASTGLNSTQMRGVEEAARQMEAATDGQITATILRTDESNPLPSFNDITVAALSDETVNTLCRAIAGGCAIADRAGEFGTMRVVVRQNANDQTTAHEIGHAALGLCHMQAMPPDFGVNPLMSVAPDGNYHGRLGRLTEVELEAVKAVYAAGLRPGAVLSDFRRAGLVSPTLENASAHTGPGSLIVQ
jgi:hypothetical protein